MKYNFFKALDSTEVFMEYQPIVDIRTGRWLGVEALVRWEKHGLRPIPADEFIQLAETQKEKAKLTRAVCKKVVDDYYEYMTSCKNFFLTINLFPENLEDPNFPDFICELLNQYRMPSGVLVFEITEAAVLNLERCILQIERLRGMGHLIVLDDFGSGYSSLGYLVAFPVDIIKIDKIFLKKENLCNTTVVLSAIINLAKVIGLAVIVEGVEDLGQVKLLDSLGVKFVQGFNYSAPLKARLLVRKYFSLNLDCISSCSE